VEVISQLPAVKTIIVWRKNLNLFRMEQLLTTEGLVSLLTLTFLEIVLGIDNVVFVSIVSGKLPATQQKKARYTGIGLALIARIILLLAVSWLIGLQKPIFTINDFHLSYRDIILILGGLFLIGKSVSEIHSKLEGIEKTQNKPKTISLKSAIIQIVLIDLIFSIDSILTAIGLVESILIIVIAILISLAVMIIFVNRISVFIEKHPTMKLLAISFLIMIGTLLVIEGFHVHVPRGYIYFAMAFALGVELLNMKVRVKTLASEVGVSRKINVRKGPGTLEQT
jgi:predicted tellurium resistance membrane protein TerC